MISGSVFCWPTRCSSPVPHPLSVVNSVKAWNLNRFMGGEGVADVRGLIRGVWRRHFVVCDFSCAL